MQAVPDEHRVPARTTVPGRLRPGPTAGSAHGRSSSGSSIGLVVGAGARLPVAATRSPAHASQPRAGRASCSSTEAQREADALRREAQIEAREGSPSSCAPRSSSEVHERRAEIAQARGARRSRRRRTSTGKLTELDAPRAGRRRPRGAHEAAPGGAQGGARLASSTELERISGMTVNEAKAHLLERSEELVRHELARRVRQAEEEARAEAQAPRPQPRRRRAAARGGEPRLRDDRLADRAAVRRHEGPDHRPRGPQHPRARAPDRRRRHHRRHAAGGRALVVRRHPPRDREADADEADRGRAHPPGADRGDVLPVEGGDRGARSARPASRPSSRRTAASSTRSSSRSSAGCASGRATGRTCSSTRSRSSTSPGSWPPSCEASVKTARRAALLHDLGKALTHEVEGSHALLSAQYARRYGESPAVVHAIEAHHYEVEPQTVEAVLLIAADAISASRPGARGESLEHYIKRLEALEERRRAATRASRRSTRSRPAARSA